jgi:hypothetical protein
MSIGRAFITDSGLIPISATGVQGPLLYYAPPSTAPGDITKIKVSVETDTGAPTVPTSSWAFTLNKVTGTKAGGAAVTPGPIGADQTAANVVASSGSTAITGLAQSTEIWEGTAPTSPGCQPGDDDPNTGEEVHLAASGQYAFYVRIPAGPGAGANLFVRVVAWHFE